MLGFRSQVENTSMIALFQLRGKAWVDKTSLTRQNVNSHGYMWLRVLILRFLWICSIKYKCCLRASVDTEMCCPKGKCGCQYCIVSFAKVTRYISCCLIFFGEDIYRHVLLSNAIHLLNKIFFKLNICVPIHVADSWNTVCE